MGFISLVDEIQFMLISSRHICIRSVDVDFRAEIYQSNTHQCFELVLYNMHLTGNVIKISIACSLNENHFRNQDCTLVFEEALWAGVSA